MKRTVRLTESELIHIIENLTLGHELEEKNKLLLRRIEPNLNPKTLIH